MKTTEQKGNQKSEELLLRCCEKRQKLYALLQRSLDEGSQQYDEEMRQLHGEIDQLMKQMGDT